jgi:hypothetical protein
MRKIISLIDLGRQKSFGKVHTFYPIEGAVEGMKLT